MASDHLVETNGAAMGRLSAGAVAKVALAALAVACLTPVYVFLFREFPHNSDDANTLLVAHDMLAGNWRLAGWWLGSDTYWTSDDLLQVALLKLFGPDPGTMLVLPAALQWAGVVVAAGCFAAAARARPIGALLLVAVVLGAPMLRWNGPMTLITRPAMHIASALYVLAMFALAARAIRERWAPLTLAACAGMTALAVAGDPMMYFVGVAPVALASGIAAWMERDRGSAWVCGAVIAGAVIGGGIVALNEATGGFQTQAAPFHFVAFDRLGSNVALAMHSILVLTGTDFFDRRLQPALPFIVRLPVLLLVLGGLALAGRRYARAIMRGEAGLAPFDRFLVAGVALNVLAAVASNLMRDAEAARYFFPALIFAVILAARILPARPWVSGLCGVALAVTVLVNGRSYLREPTRPAIVPPGIAELAGRLAAEGLRGGYGPYWSSGIVTAATGGAVRIRDVEVDEAGKLVPRKWFGKTEWYDGFGQRRPFFVVIEKPTAPDDVSEGPIVATFGKPTREIELRGSTIAVFE